MNALCDYSSIQWRKGHVILAQSDNPSGFKPYEHQEETWRRMDAHFSRHMGGIIWIPTGGGKTVIAAKWLLENGIDRGFKVIWFAHMGTLLRQAAETFNAILCKYPALKNRNRQVRCALVVSQAYGGTSWKNVEKDCDIVFASLDSSTRNSDHLHSFLKTARKGVYIVFDEVQHAYAPTYLKLLKKLKEKDRVFLIGLSATPYRMAREESIKLWELFDAYDHIKSVMRPITRVLQEDLVGKKILARPIFHNLHTNIRPEVPGGRSVVDAFHELTPDAKKSLSENESRNRLICEEYLRNYREKTGLDRYEKTIIFTPSIEGNQALFETFTQVLHERGFQNAIRVAYIDSTVNEYERVRIIREFRTPRKEDSRNSIDVLINVDMCTEGFDAPLTRTIFLARPTSSRALVRQMIGRAMRGPLAGGDDKCHIVRFVDRLPEDYDLIDPEEVIEEEKVQDIEKILSLSVPPEVIKQYKRMITPLAGRISCLLPFKYDYIPHGWYYLQPESSVENGESAEEGRDPGVYVMVLEHQERGFRRLAADLVQKGAQVIGKKSYALLVRDYFSDCRDPLPSESVLAAFVGAFPSRPGKKDDEIKIMFSPFTSRENISPWALREKVQAAVSTRIVMENLFREYPILKDFYSGEPELCHDIRMYEFSREEKDQEDHDGIDSSACRKFIVHNKDEKRERPFYPMYKNLCEVYPSLYTLHVPRKVSITEYQWKDHSSPLGFCRFSREGIELHIAQTLHSKAIPLAVREYVVFHLVTHAAIPYEHHGPIFRVREEQFRPTTIAERKFVGLPVWKNGGVKNGDVRWAGICRKYLGIFLGEVTEKPPGKPPRGEFPLLDEYL